MLGAGGTGGGLGELQGRMGHPIALLVPISPPHFVRIDRASGLIPRVIALPRGFGAGSRRRRWMTGSAAKMFVSSNCIFSSNLIHIVLAKIEHPALSQELSPYLEAWVLGAGGTGGGLGLLQRCIGHPIALLVPTSSKLCKIRPITPLYSRIR